MNGQRCPSDNGGPVEAFEPPDPGEKVARFYDLLREEVTSGDPYLSEEEQRSLQGHYDVIMQPGKFHPRNVRSIYQRRRAPAVAFIGEWDSPIVFDAGCGYGSESFLFAASGAKVLGVDRSDKQIEIAVKRQRFYEERLERSLDIQFEVADLESYRLGRSDIVLTWLSSVLAAIKDQETLLRRICDATGIGGRIMITDMNLLNPLFSWHVASRIRRAKALCDGFAHECDFWTMFRRQGRKGARFYRDDRGRVFDDVQFFWSRTLNLLLTTAGFTPLPPSFSGFVPPFPVVRRLVFLDELMARSPLLSRFGYFYLMVGWKEAAEGNRVAEGAA
jgi:SAM-dependent methyltransferase